MGKIVGVHPHVIKQRKFFQGTLQLVEMTRELESVIVLDTNGDITYSKCFLMPRLTTSLDKEVSHAANLCYNYIKELFMTKQIDVHNIDSYEVDVNTQIKYSQENL